MRHRMVIVLGVIVIAALVAFLVMRGCRSTADIDSTPAKRIGGLRDCRLLSDRPDERRFAALGGLQMHGNVPPAASSETFEQALQYLCAGRTVVADAFHQLPALLP